MAQVRKDKIQVELEINGQKRAGKTINDLKKDYRQLNREIGNLEIGSDQYIRKMEQSKKIKKFLADQRKGVQGVRKALDTTTASAGKMQKGFRNISTSVKSFGATLQTALGPIGLISAAVGALVSLLKVTAAETQEMQKLREEVNQLTGLTGDALDQNTAKAQALANVFQVDVKEGINAANAAANAYIEQGQIIDEVFPAALDKISDRLVGLDQGKGEEFLSQVKEYAPIARQAGLSMDRFFNIVVQGLNKGVPTDKLIDSLKEFDIRIKTITKGQQATLQQTFGKQFSDEIVSAVETGEISSVEALERIQGKIGEVGEESAAAKRVISDLFGGPGEDATARYLSLITDVGEALSDVQDETNIYIQRKRELFELETQANEATARLASLTDGSGAAFQRAGIQMKNSFLTVLGDIVQYIRYFPEYFQAATSGGKAFTNSLISGFNKTLRVMLPFLSSIEKLTGVSLKIPEFEIEDDPFAEVEQKIKEDREKLAEQQKQAALREENKIQESIRLAQLQAQRRRFQELGVTRKEEQEKILSLEEEFQRQFQDLLKEENAKEEKIEKDGYKEQLAALKQKENEKLTILTNEALKEIELGRDVQDAEEDMRENILLIQRRFLAERIELAKQFGQDATALEAALARINLAIAKGGVEETEEVGLFGITQSKMDKTIAIAESAASILGSIQDTIAAAQQRRLNQELADLDRRREAELEGAGDNAKKKEAIEKRYQAKKVALEQEAARKAKRVAISRAVIDGSLAVMRIAADVPKVDFGISTALLIAAQVAATAAQVATISSQTFAKGGVLPGLGGVPEGPSHRKGGIKLVAGGSVMGEIEGGEPILSKPTYRNNRDLVDALLYSSQKLGGARIFDSGGFLPSTSTTPSSEVIERAAFFSDSNIVSGLGRIEERIGGLQLRIGELEAAEIGKMYDDYQGRKNEFQI